MNSDKNNNPNQLFRTKKQQIILFVDDEPSIHKALNMMFHDIGNYIIKSAYNGEEAIKKAKVLVGKIDLLLLDVMLLDMLGNEVYKVLERDKLLNDVPVIFQTGYIGHGAEITSLLKAGKAKIIYKPYTRVELLTAINKSQLK